LPGAGSCRIMGKSILNEIRTTVAIRFYLFADDGLYRISHRLVTGLIRGTDAMPQYAGAKQKTYCDCCLGLMPIKLSSAAVAIIAPMPPRLSAICITSPSEMSTSAMWLANASRTARQ
jgi:hypothetical protein